jgi:GH43 family beta-xylosidase
VQQNIYIAKMKNPWTVEGNRMKLSSPDYDWEQNGDLHDAENPPHVNVNEGPEILEHNDKIFLIYSASGCWTDQYALGMLTASSNADLMNASSWEKSLQPVFKQSLETKVYAPGHNTFFTAANGKENWILYHANSKPGEGCEDYRSPRAQPFTWDKNGYPVFGKPVSTKTALPVPGHLRTMH